MRFAPSLISSIFLLAPAFLDLAVVAAGEDDGVMSVLRKQEERYRTVHITALHKINNYMIDAPANGKPDLAFSLSGELDLKYRRNSNGERPCLQYDLVTENKNLVDGSVRMNRNRIVLNQEYEAYSNFPVAPGSGDSGKVELYLPGQVGLDRVPLPYGPGACNLLSSIGDHYESMTVEGNGANRTVSVLISRESPSAEPATPQLELRIHLSANTKQGYDVYSFVLTQGDKPVHEEVFEDWEDVGPVRLPRTTRLKWYSAGLLAIEYVFVVKTWEVNAAISADTFSQSIPPRTLVLDYRHTLDDSARAVMFAVEKTPEEVLEVGLLAQNEEQLMESLTKEGLVEDSQAPPHPTLQPVYTPSNVGNGASPLHAPEPVSAPENRRRNGLLLALCVGAIVSLGGVFLRRILATARR